MSIGRFVVDLGMAGDATQAQLDEIAEKIKKTTDSVIGMQVLAEKQGNTTVAYHVHVSTRGRKCADCEAAAQDMKK
jgi:low affinity Fe/Cu permease